jgi:tryptophan synthase beta chain
MTKQTHFNLTENDIPKFWYNINADTPCPPAPVLNPATFQPVTPDDLLPLFPMEIIQQEVSTERYIQIPDEVRELYKLWRPTPLIRAHRLEKALGTPAHLYFKYEGTSPAGSHKFNTALPQAFYNKTAGTKALTTETGAGQWGSALSIAAKFFDLALEVYMVKVSYEQKPYRRFLMEANDAQVFASPTNRTNSGRAILAQDPDSPGSLGIAISEAAEVAATSGGAKKYSLGSVLNHVLLHQTVVGLEAKEQLRLAGDYPDVVLACHGGGSNFGGLALPFAADRAAGKPVRLVACEPASCPTLTRGVYAFDYGDTARLAPVLKMYTLGHDFTPPGIHAGGLRYHGASPLVSQLVHAGLVEARAVPQTACFEAATLFAGTEAIVPAPESSHAIRAAVDEALRAKEEGVERTILFNLSGHGHMDMSAYDAYLAGSLEDFEYPAEKVKESLARLPKVTG